MSKKPNVGEAINWKYIMVYGFLLPGLESNSQCSSLKISKIDYMLTLLNQMRIIPRILSQIVWDITEQDLGTSNRHMQMQCYKGQKEHAIWAMSMADSTPINFKMQCAVESFKMAGWINVPNFADDCWSNNACCYSLLHNWANATLEMQFIIQLRRNTCKVKHLS